MLSLFTYAMRSFMDTRLRRVPDTFLRPFYETTEDTIFHERNQAVEYLASHKNGTLPSYAIYGVHVDDDGLGVNKFNVLCLTKPARIYMLPDNESLPIFS